MIITKYPQNRHEANALLHKLRTGCVDMSTHLIRYCLLMTGDLA